MFVYLWLRVISHSRPNYCCYCWFGAPLSEILRSPAQETNLAESSRSGGSGKWIFFWCHLRLMIFCGKKEIQTAKGESTAEVFGITCRSKTLTFSRFWKFAKGFETRERDKFARETRSGSSLVDPVRPNFKFPRSPPNLQTWEAVSYVHRRESCKVWLVDLTHNAPVLPLLL